MPKNFAGYVQRFSMTLILGEVAMGSGYMANIRALSLVGP